MKLHGTDATLITNYNADNWRGWTWWWLYF